MAGKENKKAKQQSAAPVVEQLVGQVQRRPIGVAESRRQHGQLDLGLAAAALDVLERGQVVARRRRRRRDRRTGRQPLEAARGLRRDVLVIDRPGDLNVFETALRSFEEPEVRRREGAAARRRVVEQFGLERSVENYRSVIFPETVPGEEDR